MHKIFCASVFVPMLSPVFKEQHCACERSSFCARMNIHSMLAPELKGMNLFLRCSRRVRLLCSPAHSGRRYHTVAILFLRKLAALLSPYQPQQKTAANSSAGLLIKYRRITKFNCVAWRALGSWHSQLESEREQMRESKLALSNSERSSTRYMFT